MPVSFSFNVCTAHQNSRRPSAQHEGKAEDSPSPRARRELQLLEEHRPWEMLDNMALAIIDQTYDAMRENFGWKTPTQPDRCDVTVSQTFDPADPGSPEPPMLCVEASERHCCIHVTTGDASGELTEHASLRPRRSWPPRHRLRRASINASLGTLCLARVDGGGRGDYWRCADADDVRADVAGKGLVGVLDAIRSRLDAAARLEARMLEIARARRCRGPKAREIYRVWAALEDMKREVDLDVMVRRRRFQKRLRLETTTLNWHWPTDGTGMDVDREDGAEEVTKKLKALHV